MLSAVMRMTFGPSRSVSFPFPLQPGMDPIEGKRDEEASVAAEILKKSRRFMLSSVTHIQISKQYKSNAGETQGAFSPLENDFYKIINIINY
jgi:hypothetical protein